MIWLTLFACGFAWTPAPGDVNATFPHPGGYEDLHGDDGLNPTACFNCHALSESQTVRGAAPATPSCHSCHSHPHSADFAQGAKHGALWTDDPTECVTCHGERGQLPPRGLLRGQCTGCHSTFPHPEDWADTHGQAALRRGGVQGCVDCHPSSTSCRECHASYPHPEDWADTHGAAFRAPSSSPVTCLSSCHAPESPSSVPCASCHVLFPHSPSWRTEHAAQAQSHGVLSCERCHNGDPLVGPTRPMPCTSACHNGGPR